VDHNTARMETEFLQVLLRKTVEVMNMAVFIARQWENLAIRMVTESRVLSKETKQKIFRNFLYSDEEKKKEKHGANGACKLHQWFLKAVFGTSGKKAQKFAPLKEKSSAALYFSAVATSSKKKKKKIVGSSPSAAASSKKILVGSSSSVAADDSPSTAAAVPSSIAADDSPSTAAAAPSSIAADDSPSTAAADLSSVVADDSSSAAAAGPSTSAFSSMDTDPFQGFSGDGRVTDSRYLAAFSGDPYLDGLIASFKNDEVLGNVILAARRLWCRGFEGRWNDFPDIPSSRFLTKLIEEMAKEMDRETAANLTRNFLRYHEQYISYRLKEFDQNHDTSLPKNKNTAKLFSYLINMISLDGQPELSELQKKCNVDSPEIQNFILHYRKELASIMGVEEICRFKASTVVDYTTKVDIYLALGLAGEKCIQTDFLIPAILYMANKINMPVTVIPLSKSRHRPITFNSGETQIFLNNIVELAEKFKMDVKLAGSIKTKYMESSKNIAKDSPDSDLFNIEFLFNVSTQVLHNFSLHRGTLIHFRFS
jgi:hypothetical protein